MRKDYIEFQRADSPLGYLITFRCYGTWVHGDDRGSVDRNHRQYGMPMLPPSCMRANRARRLMKQLAVTLDSAKRKAVEAGIRDICYRRQWSLLTLNIRTNHVHAVTSASGKPSAMLSALKAGATKAMREAGCWTSDRSPWAHRGSKRYLWSEAELAAAIEYVQYGQGDVLNMRTSSRDTS